MAKIIVNGSIVKFPTGGLVQFMMAYVVGLKKLGHEVYFIEKSEWEYACFDMSQLIMTDDCTYGLHFLQNLLKKYGLENKWCFFDYKGNYYGMDQNHLTKLFNECDVYLDLEWGEWDQGSENVPIRVFIDGEPGWFQFKLSNMVSEGQSLPKYDYYFTDGFNIGDEGNIIPTVGIDWKKAWTPILIENPKLSYQPPSKNAPFSTVMNWKSHKEVTFNGKVYGQKNIEFEKFMALPKFIKQAMEVAVSGEGVPHQKLKDNFWSVKSAFDVVPTVDAYHDYISRSKGEFCIAKNVFVDSQCGWFGERAGYYMLQGRPVISQDTGFSKHLPCGLGILAINTLDEAIEAIDRINSEYTKHAHSAREMVFEYFDSDKVLKKIMEQIGI
jgi:hypothetical protein